MLLPALLEETQVVLQFLVLLHQLEVVTETVLTQLLVLVVPVAVEESLPPLFPVPLVELEPQTKDILVVMV